MPFIFFLFFSFYICQSIALDIDSNTGDKSPIPGLSLDLISLIVESGSGHKENISLDFSQDVGKALWNTEWIGGRCWRIWG